MEKKDTPIVFGKRNNGIIDNLMDGKRDRLLKLVNMAENGTEEEKLIAAFIEDNEFSIQAFLSDYNHPGLVRIISKWLDEKD